MKKLPLSFLFTVILVTTAPSAGFAKFTGMMDMMLKMPNGSAEITYFFGTGAQRMDMFMQLEKIPEPLKTTVITRESRPDEALIVNHQARTYSQVNLRTAAENATLLDFDSNYKLSRAGTAVIKGYQCEHILLTSSTEKLELWTSKDVADFSTFRLLQSQNPRLSNTSLAKTLKNSGIEGFPVKIVQHNDNGLYLMELMQVSSKPVAASAFAIPNGYRKTSPGQKAVDSTQKKHLRNLMEKMKDFEW
jgi:hypothetical protein